MFKGFPGSMEEALEAAQQMQQGVADIKENVEKQEVSASVGGGMVSVTVNGAGALKAITIDPAVVNPDDVEMLQDLVVAAVNEGVRKSRDLLQEEMKKVTGGIPIPGLFS